MGHPTYKTEPREDLEERALILAEMLVAACIRAEESDCNCEACVDLRALYENRIKPALPDAIVNNIRPIR